ncbi:MAG: GAF domain-containing protein [Chloroflexi bacterium]|nr:GAF domain-containing protein [Chloroflexota bacterium]
MQRGMELRLTALYLIFGGLWVLLSDRMLAALTDDPRLQTVKGWLYVLLTGIVLYAFLRWQAHWTRQQAAALAYSEARQRALLNALPDLIFQLNRFGVFLDCKPSGMGLLLPPEEFVGRRIQDLMPDIAPRALAAIRQALATGKTQVFTYRLPVGDESHDYEARIMAQSADEVVAIVRDITEHRRADRALRDSEKRYRLLFEQANDIIFLIQDGKLIDCNSTMLDAFGQPYENLIGMTPLDVSPPVQPDGCRSAEVARQKIEAALAGEPQFFQWQHQHAGGSLFDVEVRLNLVRLHGKNLVLGIERDITERKHAELERERLLRQAETRARQLATVSAVSLQVSAILDIDQLLRTIVELTTENFQIYHTHIYLLDAKGEALVLAASSGEAGQHLVESGHSIPLDFEPSLVARAARTRSSLVSNDTPSEPDFLPNPWLPDTRSELAMPMIVGSELIGVLDVQDNHPGRFTDEDIQVKAILASQIATAVQNARLFAENARRLAIIENSSDAIALAPVQGPPYYGTYVNLAGLKLTGLESVEAFAQQPLASFYPDDVAERIRREVLPVVFDQGLWKGESLFRRPDGTIIPIEQTILLIKDERGQPRDLATIISDITERKRAEAALRTANRAYRVLSECNQAMVRANDEHELVSTICQIVVGVDSYRMAWVGYLQDDEAQTLQPVTYAGYSDGYVESLRLNAREHSPTAHVIRTHRPAIIHDIETDPEFEKGRAVALARGYRSGIALPLLINEQLIGTLNVYSDEPHAFDSAEVDLLVELADDLAFGISTLRTRAHREQAEAELRQSRANLIALIDNTADHIWSVDRDLHLITMNSAYVRQIERLAGSTPAAGDSLLMRMPPNVLATWKPLYERALAGERFSIEKHYNFPDRPDAHSEIALNPIRAETGEVVGVAVFARNITHRKQAEIARQQLNERLEQRNRVLLALHGAGRRLTGTLDLDEIYHVMYEEIGRHLLAASRFSIALYDDSRELLLDGFVVQHGTPVDPAQYTPVKLKRSPARHAIRAREPRRIALAAGKAGMRAALYVPLISRDRVIGVIGAQHEDSDAFADVDNTLLAILANQAAIAVQNAQLFAAERDQRALAEALRDTAAAVSSTLDFNEVLDRILANVGRVVPHQAANIMLIEDGVARIVRGHGYAEHGLAEWIEAVRFRVDEIPIWQRMITTGRPFAIPDTWQDPEWMAILGDEEAWIRSTVKAPIYSRGSLVGILHLDSDVPGAFNAHHAERLQAFADQASLAVQNAQSYDEAQHHAATMERHVQERTAELKAQSQQLKAILDAMGEGVVHTVGWEIKYTNQAFVHLLGYSIEQFQAEPFSIDSLIRVISNYEALVEAVPRIFQHGESWRGVMHVQRPDGVELDVAMTITQIGMADSLDKAAAVTILRDVSQEKALQAQKDRFIANASHELRTPLANMKTRLYLIEKQPDKLDLHLDVLRRVTATMTELVENLLDVSRFERGVISLYRQPLELQTLLTEVVSIQQPEAERKQIALVTDLPDEPIRASVDFQRLSQVFTNLITNAINYTPEGGRITVELDQEIGPDRTRAIIRIRDTGPGISPDQLAHVFEPFFRANDGTISGAGLGLTIAREIVHLHDGELRVESELGRGSTFAVLLDLSES